MTHDHELERAVLATCLLAEDPPPEAALLLEDDFTAPDHVRMFRALRALWNEGEASPSIEAVALHAAQSGEPINPEEIARVFETLGYQGRMFRSRAGTLRTLHCRRRIAALRRMEIADPRAYMARAADELDAIRALMWTDDAGEIRVVERLILSAMEHQQRVPTGIASLDDIVHGVGRSEFVVLGARPSVGKSALALTIALNMAQQQVPVLFLSLEQTRDAQLWRAVASLTRGDANAMKSDPHHWQAEIARAAKDLEAMPLRIVEPAWGIEAIEQVVRADHKARRCRVVVVDYLQLVTLQAQSEYERVTRVTARLKHLAKQSGIGLIACAQINRGAGKDRPTMAHLKSSGQIEQDADQVWLLHREPDEHGRPSGMSAQLIVEKNREGATGATVLDYFPSQTRFDSRSWGGDPWE